MATAKQLKENPSTEQKPDEASVPSNKPARRRRALLLVEFATLVALVWLLPMIVAATSLRNQVVPVLAPGFKGSCTVEAATLSWFSPVKLEHIDIKDEHSDPFLTIESFSSDQTLFDLVRAGLSGGHLGKLQLRQPTLKLVVRGDGSNLEDTLESLLAGDESSSSMPELDLEITGGKLELIEADSDRRGHVDDFSISFSIPAESDQPLSMKLTAIIYDATKPGRLDAELQWTPSAEASASSKGIISIKSDGFRLDAVQPLWARVAADVQVSGALRCDLRTEWMTSGDKIDCVASGQLSWTDFLLSAPDYLGRDRLQCETLSAGGEIEWRDRKLVLRDCKVDSELGKLTASGTYTATEPADTDFSAALAQAMQKSEFQIRGELDLPRLTQTLPETLQIRNDTTINSGKLSFELSGSSADQQPRFRSRIHVSDITADQNGRILKWEEPVTIAINARNWEQQLAFDEIQCDSNFLQVSGSGTLDDLKLSLSCDLDRLAKELGQFVDLEQVKLAGRVKGELRCRRKEDLTLLATAKLTTDDFLWQTPGHRPWRERNLLLEASSEIQFDQASVARVNETIVKLSSGTDQLEVEQLQAFEPSDNASAFPVQMKLQGQLSTWSARLQPWTDIENWTLSGDVDLQSNATIRTAGVAIENGKLTIRNLRARSDSLQLEEPQVHLETSATWNRDDKQFSTPLTTLATTTVSARCNDLAVKFREGLPPELSGKVSLRGVLERMQRWFQKPGSRPQDQLMGVLTGQVQFAPSENSTRFDWNLSVPKLTVTQRQQGIVPRDRFGRPIPGMQRPDQWKTVFNDGPISLAGSGQYDSAAGKIDLQAFEFAGLPLQLKMKGTVVQLSDDFRVNLSGEMEYDLARLSRMFAGILGSNLSAVGHETRAFSVNGPMFASATTDATANGHDWPLDLQAQAGLSWTSANIYGLRAGPAKWDIQLKQGVVTVPPVDMTVSGGRLVASPQLHLNRQPAQLVLNEGARAENLQFTPEQCRTWLKYLAPLLADATRIDGQFSVHLNGGTVPLTDPQSCEMSGNLKIHSAQIVSGPMVDQFRTIARQIEAIRKRRPLQFGDRPSEKLVTLTEQNVAFQMANRRVHHQGLKFSIDDVLITTSGSVGLDDTLQLTAQVPIQDEWVQSDRYLAGLRGQVIQIPISGTLKRPQMDRRALDTLVNRLAGAAAKGFLENELGKQLNRLFRPQKR